MDRARLWTRVGRWFRNSGRYGGYIHENAFLDDDAAASQRADGSGKQPGAGLVSAADAGGSASRFRSSRGPSSVERLEEEYARIIRLVESIQTHLDRQGERAESIARSLDRLAESLGHLPEASKNQLGLLSAIREQMDLDGACAKRVEESLSQLPQLADAQRETMVTIGRQMDSSRQSNERVATTLEGFQQAVTLLGEATSVSARALQELRSEASTRDDRMTAALEVQTKRLTLFAFAAIALMVVAAVAGVLGLFE
jgi:archaellum component FlaC